MSNFKGEYLRVLTPRTIDGVNLKYDSDRQPTYKESHLPVSALKSLNMENAARADQLKHVIEHAGVLDTTAYNPEPLAPSRPQRIKRENPKPNK